MPYLGSLDYKPENSKLSDFSNTIGLRVNGTKKLLILCGFDGDFDDFMENKYHFMVDDYRIVDMWHDEDRSAQHKLEFWLNVHPELFV